MRRGLFWALGATVAMSVAALWGTETPKFVSAVEPRIREHMQSLDLGRAAPLLAVSTPAPLPAELPRLALEVAKRDVFVPIEPPAPKPTPAPAPVVAAPPPPPPQAPPLNLRFLGSMMTPAGQRLLYLARGDKAVAVAIGDRLDEGYVVESLSAEGVTLVYPPLDVRVTVPVPPASQH